MAATSCALFGVFDKHGVDGQPPIFWHVNGVGVSTPAYDGSTVYFLANNHTVVALRGSDGSQLWTGHTYDVAGQTFGFGGCAIVADLVVCNDSTLVALRRADGALVWRFHPTVGGDPGYDGFVVVGNIVVAGSPAGTVYGVDAATGEQLWVQSMLTGTGTTINVTQISADSDAVFAPYTRFLQPQRGGVMALDTHSGALRWITDFPRPAPDSLTGAASSATWSNLVLASSADGRIYALDRATGSVQWNLPGVGNGGGSLRGPFGADIRGITISGSTLYAGSLSAWFVAYDVAARTELWRVDMGGSDQTFDSVVDGSTIYDVLANGHLIALSAGGKELWNYGDASTLFVGRAVAAADRVFLASATGFWAIGK
jgi:outer membrane protein assembly factor BamB